MNYNVRSTGTDSKSHIFICSSAENIEWARAIQQNLEGDAVVTVWDQAGYEPTQSTLSSLEASLPIFDIAVFVLNPDNTATNRNTQRSIVRDNVLFELGLFVGGLGSRRCFNISQSDKEDFPFLSGL